MKQHEQMFPKTFVNAESPQYSDLPNQRVRPVCVCSSGYFGGEHILQEPEAESEWVYASTVSQLQV